MPRALAAAGDRGVPLPARSVAAVVRPRGGDRAVTQAVSGPGPYSQRTDQKKQPISVPTGLPYGQNQALRQIEQAAPMQATPPTPQVTPIHAPSQLPGQPVTSGAALGPGPDASVLTSPQRVQPAGSPRVQALSNASASDPSGSLALLLAEAMKRGL